MDLDAIFLSDCAVKEPAQAEIFIVTSEKEYHLARRDRDRMTQAILPIAPDFLPDDELLAVPVEEKLWDVLDDRNCQNLISALGVGILLPGYSERELYQYTKLRYGKVIVVAEHRVLHKILRFFSIFMPDLLSTGHVFIPTKSYTADADEDELLEGTLNPTTRRIRVIDQEEIKRIS